jgi:GH15 family glucan-1,4-alpha-glucosidase
MANMEKFAKQQIKKWRDRAEQCKENFEKLVVVNLRLQRYISTLLTEIEELKK